jgi:NAD(P)-dependent dehydrogenase (short-subunit alcohol dehydrogenase family)
VTDLRGDVVVVTGAATGVGRALAREAAGRGAEVVAIDVNDPAETVEIISSSGGRARGAIGDVRDETAMQALATEICGNDGMVNLVCANAGGGAGGTVDAVSSDDFRSTLDLNVMGALHTVHAFLPALRRPRPSGRTSAVLLTGSEHSLGVPPHVPPMTAYTTAKHALLGLAACMRRDLAADGISVSILCPGYVRTERLRAYAESSGVMAETLATYGQDGEVVARRAFDGVASGRFAIPTNPLSRDFVVALHEEILHAMREL